MQAAHHRDPPQRGPAPQHHQHPKRQNAEAQTPCPCPHGPTHRPDLATDIMLRRDQRRHDQQHQKHAKTQTIDQRDHRGLQELRLLALLIKQRGHAKDRCQRGQHHRPQPVRRAIDD